MTDGKWLAKYGLDPEKRKEKIRTCKRIQLFGYFLLTATILSFFYLMFFEHPQNHQDVFLFAFSLAVCISASFAVLSSMETEIKLLQLMDEFKKSQG